MAQQYKIDRVKYLTEFFDNNNDFIFNNYSGLNVEKITALRKELNKNNTKFIVAKNNFIRRILKEKNINDFDDYLEGPTAVAFVKEDASEVLKVLFNFAKKSTLKVKAGWIENYVYDEKALDELSMLPGKSQLIAMLMSTLNAPVQNFESACNDVLGRLSRG